MGSLEHHHRTLTRAALSSTMAPREGQPSAPPWHPERSSLQPCHGGLYMVQRGTVLSPTMVPTEGQPSAPPLCPSLGTPLSSGRSSPQSCHCTLRGAALWPIVEPRDEQPLWCLKRGCPKCHHGNSQRSSPSPTKAQSDRSFPQPIATSRKGLLSVLPWRPEGGRHSPAKLGITQALLSQNDPGCSEPCLSEKAFCSDCADKSLLFEALHCWNMGVLSTNHTAALLILVSSSVSTSYRVLIPSCWWHSHALS